MLKFAPFDDALRDAIMTRRRLRLPAAIALLSLAAPVLATPPDSGTNGSSAPTLRSSARQFGVAVKHSSTEFGRRVAHGAREAGQQFHTDMHQVGLSVHRWWAGVRSGMARV
jgi:hypothetical protein